MTKGFDVKQLAASVMWWLGYTSTMGRNYILSESAIKFPVAEYLGQSTTKGIELEYGHPKLFMKRFDLFFKHGLNEIVFEFKYIKDGSTGNPSEKQRVFDDLMRLHLYVKKNHKGYFLICGNQFQFNTSFQSPHLKPTNNNGIYIQPKVKATPIVKTKSIGFYDEWFSFERNTPKKVIDIKKSKRGYKKFYNAFFNKYKKPFKKETGNTFSLPNSITTNLIFLSGNINQPSGLLQTAKIGIWEIT